MPAVLAIVRHFREFIVIFVQSAKSELIFLNEAVAEFEFKEISALRHGKLPGI